MKGPKEGIGEIYFIQPRGNKITLINDIKTAAPTAALVCALKY